MPEISETESVGIHIPIIHPEELDRMLEDEAFSDNIAGVTTASIDAVRRVLSGQGNNFKVYDRGFVNLDLVDDAYGDLTGHTITDKVPPSRTISLNSETYGQLQAAVGLLYERAISPEAAKELSFYGDFEEFTQRPNSDFTDDELEKKFATYQGVSDYIRELWPKEEEQNKEFEKALRDAFPDARNLTEYLKDLRSRNGVQVIIGDRSKFVDFVKSQKHERVADKGIELYADIPRNLILGVVPRGRFEQQELLAA